jgi:hypothetical protein
MICPNCGAEVPPCARACRECGSDERTGWSRDGGDLLPSEPASPRSPSRAWGRIGVAAITLGAFVTCWILGGALALAAGVIVAAALFGVSRLRVSAPMRERELQRRLASRARGDADLPRRLVEAEMRRRPGITRLQALELALSRLEHDRR